MLICYVVIKIRTLFCRSIEYTLYTAKNKLRGGGLSIHTNCSESYKCSLNPSETFYTCRYEQKTTRLTVSLVGSHIIILTYASEGKGMKCWRVDQIPLDLSCTTRHIKRRLISPEVRSRDT